MMINTLNLVTQLPYVLAEAPPVVPATDENAGGAMPPELRQWLVRLRLLDGVPFAYLVPDTELLPQESVRWFYVDRRWTDALVQGALAVGTANSDDRTQLAAAYPAMRDELDREERNVRRRAGSERLTGDAGPVSGFLLRSRVVSGWPALHVRAYSAEPVADDTARVSEDAPSRMRLLRLERLAPAVLLCLFDGVPAVVHVEEPRQGVQFGFDASIDSGAGEEVTAVLHPRRVATFEDLGGEDIEVPFRPGSTGVVDIQELERRLARREGTGAGDVDGLDSSEYALQLVRRPFRQVFGPATATPVTAVFTATVSYENMLTRSFQGGQVRLPPRLVASDQSEPLPGKAKR